jgi:cytochrome c556
MVRDMRAVLLLALGILGSCQAAEPKLQLMASERKEFIHHMGHNQMIMFQLQSETGEPLDQQAINNLLDRMIHHYEASRKIRIVQDEKYNQGLDAMFERIIGEVRFVRSKTWTKENVGEYFGIVGGHCATCHDRFAR